MMATALPSAIMTTPNYNHHAAASNQCIDPEDFFDFGQHASPQAATLKREASATSSIATPTNASLDDDLQTPAKPSHEYERFKQQTGLPTGSIAGLSYNPGFMFSSTGIDEMAMMGDSSSMMNPGWGTGLGIDANMNMGMDMQQPAFFFPNDNGQDDFIDPSSIVREEPAQVRVWPGMHQQQAALAKAQAQQAAAAQAQAQQQRQQQFALQRQQQAAAQQSRAQHQQQRRPAARKTSSPIDDARTAETIARVVATIRAESQNAANAMNDGSQNVLPNIIRAKKDEDDMDDDERLLASEEGKKLTSKERRQLRNKVSARAFRSRRKEYIGQLEGEVAQKVNEANELRNENRLLMEENARSRAFIERLLSHRAFAPYLEELSREEALQPQNMAPPASTLPSAPASQNQQFNGMSQNGSTHVGMTLVPDTQLDMSMLNINGSGSWGSGNGFNFNQPQVFAVHELPAGPVNPLDTEAMSGKGYSAIFRAEEEPSADVVKPDFPVLQNPMPTEAPQMVAATVEDDEDDLYSASPAPSATFSPAAALENHETLFTNPEKALAHFALVVADEAEDVRLAEHLERRLAAMEPVLQRVAALTSMLDL